MGRYGHSCGLLQDSVTGEAFVVVAGGLNGNILSSVELLKVGTDLWTAGTGFSPFVRFTTACIYI